jgi:hypothetical protein
MSSRPSITFLGRWYGQALALDEEELDDEQIIIAPHPAHKAVVLQLDAGVSFDVILDDIDWHPSRCIDATSFSIIMLSMPQVPHMTLGLRIIVLLAVRMVHE